MSSQQRTLIFVWIGLCVLPLLVVIHLKSGMIDVSLHHLWEALFQYSDEKTELVLLREFRMPRMMMALIAGSALAISGMFMQTLFQNPLAGPYVLGINAGASLMVALSMLSGISFFYQDIGIISAALLGAFSVGLLMTIIAANLRQSISLLLVGLMLGSFISAFINLLEAGAGAESLKKYALWSMGSLQQVLFSQIPLIFAVFVCGLLVSFLFVKPLNLLLLGEKTATTLGLKIQQTRIGILIITALLSGLTTAFCGPIAFVGLAIPNVTRMLLKTRQHGWLLFGNAVFGALFLLSCDVLIQWLEPYLLLPINVLTSLIGAPFVIYLVTRKRL
jgi:iron complex transport system permease protein